MVIDAQTIVAEFLNSLGYKKIDYYELTESVTGLKYCFINGSITGIYVVNTNSLDHCLISFEGGTKLSVQKECSIIGDPDLVNLVEPDSLDKLAKLISG